MAAFPVHPAIQEPQAIWKPVKSPNALRLYAYGPPVAGTRRLSDANVNASSSEPADVKIQPIMLMPPYAANDAGNKNTPDPIMLPTTSAVALPRPMARRVVRSVLSTGFVTIGAELEV